MQIQDIKDSESIKKTKFTDQGLGKYFMARICMVFVVKIFLHEVLRLKKTFKMAIKRVRKFPS